MAEYSNVTAGQYHSKILWQNAATIQRDNTVVEFFGKIQQRYNRTYRSRILCHKDEDRVYFAISLPNHSCNNSTNKCHVI